MFEIRPRPPTRFRVASTDPCKARELSVLLMAQRLAHAREPITYHALASGLCWQLAVVEAAVNELVRAGRLQRI